MEKQEYSIMYNLEDHYWWYNGLRDMVLQVLAQSGVSGQTRLLDAGCGTGGVLDAIRKEFGIEGMGFDFAKEGLFLCKERGMAGLVCASVNEMPYAPEQFDVVISLDVLCHRSVRSDSAVLADFYRMLRPGGLLILNLPAYDSLKSSHDVAVHTAHRFTRREMRSKLTAARFANLKLSYRNSILFPALALVRLLRKGSTSQEHSDLKEMPRLLNTLLSGVLYLENRLFRFCNFPFGLSLLCVARKP